MKLFRWLEAKVFLGKIVKDYGIIGESPNGDTKVCAYLCEEDGMHKLAIKGCNSVNVQYYHINLSESTVHKLSAICNDAHSLIEESKGIKNSKGESIFKDSKVQSKCANCETDFSMNENSCSKCKKAINQEKLFVVSNDIIGYKELYQKLHMK